MGLETYRSGHNGADSKSVSRATGTRVRIPPSPFTENPSIYRECRYLLGFWVSLPMLFFFHIFFQKFLIRTRSSEIESLNIVGSQITDFLKLFYGFDSFHTKLQIHTVGHLYNIVQQTLFILIIQCPYCKGSVYLDNIRIQFV